MYWPCPTIVSQSLYQNTRGDFVCRLLSNWLYTLLSCERFCNIAFVNIGRQSPPSVVCLATTALNSRLEYLQVPQYLFRGIKLGRIVDCLRTTYFGYSHHRQKKNRSTDWPDWSYSINQPYCLLKAILTWWWSRQLKACFNRFRSVDRQVPGSIPNRLNPFLSFA